MLEKARTRLQAWTPRTFDGERAHAAVLLPLIDAASPRLLLTRRAAHLSQHAGQVAFPGGKRDAGDPDPESCALREAEEEIGLPRERVELIGRLSDRRSRHGLIVTPVVGIIADGLDFRPSPAEIAALFEIPLATLLTDPRRHTDVIDDARGRLFVPSYTFGEHVLWGLSAMMVVELLAVAEEFFDPALIAALGDELDELEQHGALTRAGIGRGHAHQHRPDIRGDSIRWLTPDHPAQRHYLMTLASVRDAINRALFLGLFEFEAHFARYPVGAFYQRHVDSFRGRANRIISSVTYLNRDWPDDGGGEMVSYAPGDETRELGRVAPRAGTFVCFLAEEMPHEVLPARLPRASIAGWFRRNSSLGSIIDPAR
ncbi:Rps23 Pro-64 3,4-dihydroxylase Tpa1-like proline 4-hydroxylase [Kushneria sinocarnis]|uniref:Rps23 Pro-64 3,4-dihydroxylase Tpa1-like proline 4-hydroxylase n=1 Tax=Kushneria sinocarnis TaxID=595502 RepID=A0A420WX10_9GAMM|nr:Rps23 Pro-64 3,4-dihydroxylase Tpa1-like proline 4-hydroxylase [Kushneria sinocarnis]